MAIFILLKQRQTHKQREIIHYEKFICFTLNYFMFCCIVPVPILGLFAYTYVALIHCAMITCPLGTRPSWRCRSYSPCSCSLICILPYPNQLLKPKGIFLKKNSDKCVYQLSNEICCRVSYRIYDTGMRPSDLQY